MRQKRYDSVEKMLDLLDVCKRIGPKFPLDAMFLDPHDRKFALDLTLNSWMGWWHDLSLRWLPHLQEVSYLPHYQLCNIESLLTSNSSCSFTITTSSSTIRTCTSQQRPPSVFCLLLLTFCTSSIESRYWDAICSTSMCRWELMSLWRKENPYWGASRWRSGYGSQLICRKHWSDATDSHSKTMHLTLLTQNCYCKTSSEDTRMILWKSHSQSVTQELESESNVNSDS